MKFCPKCGSQVQDNSPFCPNCGYSAASGGPGFGNGAYYPVAVNVYDHTARFNPKDISENKIYAMLPYLMSIPGIIIALLAGTNSPYVAFHVREAVKITVCSTLLAILGVVLVWTVIVPALVAIMEFVLFCVKIAMFFSICQGKAKEPWLVRSVNFLR